MSAAQQAKIRRIVWTGSIAAITATGAWYGAGLKTQQEYKDSAKKAQEATAEEKIKMLEERRITLVGKAREIERKIGEIERRRNGESREESMRGKERR
jgi:hypothetical protein